ncbi:hypothetical protein L7F22_056690 [Adiantum nelumboides]|nr:hypothetical protein [Adiantum nelumboides]
MLDKRSEQEKTNYPVLEQQADPGKGKPDSSKMPAAIGALSAQSNSPAVGMKSASTLRQSKSFNLKDSNKAPISHGNSKISSIKSTGALSSYNGGKVDAAPPSSTLDLNGAKAAKFNSIGKSDAGFLKPKQSSSIKADNGQPGLSRSEKVKSPGNGNFKNSPYNCIGELQKKSSKETSPKPNTEGDKTASSKVTHKTKELSPKPANLAHVKSLSLSLNADPQRKLPPIKTSRTSAKKYSAKNTANLCAECKAELEGAVCFIGNDGRVSACTSRNAVRLCKNLKCANNNPEAVASLAAASAAPKKYLISRRHSLTQLPQPTLANGKNGKAIPDKVDAQAMDQDGIASSNGDFAAILPQQREDDRDCGELNMKGELEEDVVSLGDHSDEGVDDFDGIATASPQGGRLNGHQRVKRRSFNVIETQAPAEVVTLRKQMMQERKQAEEWMLDYAIEEALQKLVPSKESKVKALVEAFESVIPQKETDVTARDHQPEAPKTLNKIAIKA